MKLKKVLAIAMAVSSLAMTTTAFATANATYDATANTVSLTPNDGDIPTTSGQMTVVVVPTTFGASSTAADIYYINQDDYASFANIIKSMGLKSAISGTGYEVRVGGENLTNYVTFQISSGQTWEYGDVNADDEADISDAYEVQKYDVGFDSVFDDEAEWRLLAGNVTVKRDKDEDVDISDAYEIQKYDVGFDSTLDELRQ